MKPLRGRPTGARSTRIEPWRQRLEYLPRRTHAARTVITVRNRRAVRRHFRQQAARRAARPFWAEHVIPRRDFSEGGMALLAAAVAATAGMPDDRRGAVLAVALSASPAHRFNEPAARPGDAGQMEHP